MTDELGQTPLRSDRDTVSSSRQSHDRWTPMLFGLGFTLVPLVVLLLGYLNVHPEIWRIFPSKTVYEQSFPDTDIAWGDDEKSDPPLKYIRDKFVLVMLETDRPDVNNFWDLFETPQSTVHWSWEYEVKNLTKSNKTISVSYYLVDENGSQISDESSGSVTARPNETVTIRGKGTIPYGLSGQIDRASWGIR